MNKCEYCCLETFDEADELSDSWNSDAWNSDACLSDIPKKGDLFPKSATRIKKRKFLSDDEDVEPDDVLNRKGDLLRLIITTLRFDLNSQLKIT